MTTDLFTEWREVSTPEYGRVRWRDIPGDYARPDSGIALETWHERHGWRPVQSWAAREWFWIGLRAGGA